MDVRIVGLLSSFTIFVLLAGVESATFTFQNECPTTIWPGTLTGGGSPQLAKNGFELLSGSSVTLEVPATWSGRIWARTSCSVDRTGKFTCKTADCGSGQVSCNGAGAIPPASLAEFTLSAQFNGMDFYDISLVDGFNLPISIAPQSDPHGNCSSTTCLADLNPSCPPELATRDDLGAVIGCRSACLAFDAPEFCCTGQYSSPQTCQPTKYSSYFKSQCPQAYSYAFDDKTSTFTCAGGTNYVITFCPQTGDIAATKKIAANLGRSSAIWTTQAILVLATFSAFLFH